MPTKKPVKIKPIFQLMGYYFPMFLFSANNDYVPDKHKNYELNVQASITKLKDADDLWGVTVNIATPNNMKPGTFPYEFSVSVSALISCDLATKDEDVLPQKKILYVNAASLLYSAARERLTMFCNVPMVNPYFLPTHRFNPDDIKE